jgi:putative transposase
VSEKYTLIAAEKAEFDVSMMCRILGVSRSGFYDWEGREASDRVRRREELKSMIAYEFDQSEGTYGYRRIHAALRRKDVKVDDELVRRLMRELGLMPVQVKRHRGLTVPDRQAEPIPDLLRRDFTAVVPGEKMIGSGSRRESHPPAPTEPCVTVSRYTALATLITRNCGTSASGRTSLSIAVRCPGSTPWTS